MELLVSRLSPSRLFGRPETPNHVKEVILWWESRRLFYNVIVMVFGFFSGAAFLFIDMLPPRVPQPEGGIEPMSMFCPAVVGMVLANIFYTAGWIVELPVHLLFRRWSRLFGPILFAAGLGFSALAVWSVTILIGLDWLHRLIYGTGLGQ